VSKPKLISFKVCPFVQRSVILLKEKGVDYDIEYIDVYNPPDWFLEISPTGKVPVMQVEGAVLFESAVINEYLDEVYTPQVHPSDPLKKAQNRAWMEYTSPLYMGTFNIVMAKKKEDMEKAREEFIKNLSGLEKAKQNKPWFNGEDFSMIDIAAAPIFTRTRFIKDHCNLDLLADFPALQQWSNDLLERQTVKDSVVDGFDELMLTRMKANESYLATS